MTKAIRKLRVYDTAQEPSGSDGATGLSVWAYFGIIERLAFLDMNMSNALGRNYGKR